MKEKNKSLHFRDETRVQREYNKAQVFSYCPTTLNSDMAAVKMERRALKLTSSPLSFFLDHLLLHLPLIHFISVTFHVSTLYVLTHGSLKATLTSIPE